MTITVAQYEAICEVIDSIKQADVLDDTDVYAGRILDAINADIGRK